jgi:vitamin B12 transporter
MIRLRADRFRATIASPCVCAAGIVAACAAAALRAQPAQPDEIVVTSSIIPVPKREIGTAVSVIDAQEIELRGYDDLSGVLRTQPGVTVTNLGGVGKATVLRIRGEEGYRTELIIDGVKAVDPSGTQAGPGFDSLLATEDLARVEILRGPQGFLYGSDAGGVVNVITGRGEGPFGARVSIEDGTLDTRRVSAAASAGAARGDYYISATDYRTAGFNAQTNDTTLRDRDGADNKTLHAKLGLNLGEDWRLQLVARNIDATARYDGCFHPVTFALVHDCVATTDQTTYKVSAEHRGATITHALGYSDLDVAHADAVQGISGFASEGRLGRFEYTGSFRPREAEALVYGVDLQKERVAAPDHRERDQRGYYVEYERELGASVFVSAGARYDDNDDFGSHTSSRVSIAVLRELAAGNSLKYRASYGTGFRAPSLYEIAYDAGPFATPPAAGLSLAAEQSEGYDIGVEYYGASGARLEATLFDQSITDEIFFDLDSFSGYLQSTGRSRSKGLELGATQPLGDRFALLGNVTLDKTADTSNAARLRRPQRFGSFGVRYAANDKLRVLVNLRFARDAVDIGAVRLPDYNVWDVSATLAVSNRIEVFARLENALDASYVEAVGFNTAPRTAYAGIRLRF